MSHYYGGRGGGHSSYTGGGGGYNSSSAEPLTHLPPFADPFIRQTVAPPVAPSCFLRHPHATLAAKRYKMMFDYVGSAHEMYRIEGMAVTSSRDSALPVGEKHVKEFRSVVKNCSRRKVRCIEWNGDGTQLLYCFDDGRVRVFDAERLEQVQSYPADLATASSSSRKPGSDFTAACFDPVHGNIAIVSDKGKFILYDPRRKSSSGTTSTALHEPDLPKTNPHMSDFISVQASPRGNESMKGPVALQTAQERVHVLNRSPEQENSDRYTLRIMNGYDGETLAADGRRDGVGVDTSAINAFCYSRDGNHVLSAHQSGSFQLTKISQGKVPHYQRTKSYAAHCGGVTALAAGKNSDSFATAGFDNAVRVWDAASPSQCLNCSILGIQPASSLSFNFDGNVLACGFGPAAAGSSVGERLRQNHQQLCGAGVAGGGQGGDVRAGGELTRVQESVYEKQIVFLNPVTGEMYLSEQMTSSSGGDSLHLPGAVTVLKWSPRRNVLAFAMHEGQFTDALPEGGEAGSSSRTYGTSARSHAPWGLRNSMCQLLKLPDFNLAKIDPAEMVF